MADMTVASTTDTQAEINRAAGVVDKSEPETTEQVEQQEPETQQEPQKPEAQAAEKPSKSGFQKRIDKLTRERYADRQQLDALKAKLEALEGGTRPEVASQAPVVEQKTEDPEPLEADFTDFKEFTKALAKWTFRQEARDHDAEVAKQSAEQKEASARKAEYDAHLERLDLARERYDDFDEVADRVGRSGQFQLPIATGAAIVQADNSGDIVYYLMKNPAKCKELMGMSEARAVMEIGKISAALEAPGTTTEDEEEPVFAGGGPSASAAGAPRKKASTAPAPIRPVGGSATRSTVPLDELSYQDYRRIRDQQDKARYRR